MNTPLDRLRLPAFIVGAVALAAAIVGGLGHPDIFFRAWLVGFLFCVSIPVGALGLLMLQYLTGGAWGIVIRRILEASVRTLWLCALMFVPLAIGLAAVYIWAQPEVVAGDEIIQHKAAYLNVPFFLGRAVFYFAVWLGLGTLLLKWSGEYEEKQDPRIALKLRHVSGGGLLLLALTVTFSAIDWAMSLDPHWYSTIYGMAFMIGHMLAGMTFAIAVLVTISRVHPVSGVLQPSHLRDLGNLTLAFVMLWAYMAFSQFLLIWYGNLREEVTWYIPRMEGGWGVVSGLLIVFHFFLPFILLLMRQIKDHAKTIRIVAVLLLVMHLLDLMWVVIPSVTQSLAHAGGGHGEHHLPWFHWVDVAAPIGMIGVWLGLFITRLRTRPLMPMYEPYVQEMLEGEAVSHG
jgi:hypothetical protein